MTLSFQLFRPEVYKGGYFTAQQPYQVLAYKEGAIAAVAPEKADCWLAWRYPAMLGRAESPEAAMELCQGHFAVDAA